MIGIINAHMFGTPGTPGEYVDWSVPDFATEIEWEFHLGSTIADYAEGNPHMIVFEA